MKKWIIYAIIFAAISFTIPFLSGNGKLAGEGLVRGIGAVFAVIAFFVIRFIWRKVIGFFKSL